MYDVSHGHIIYMYGDNAARNFKYFADHHELDVCSTYRGYTHNIIIMHAVLIVLLFFYYEYWVRIAHCD